MNPNTKAPAIVIDAEKLSQIAIIQDLGHRGIPVVAVAASASAIGFRSRYAGRKLVAPAPSHHDAYLDFLLAKAPRGVLFYSNDAGAEMVAKHREALQQAGFSFLISDSETLRNLIQKERLYGVAAAAEVKVPHSRLVSAHEVASAAAEVGFPCILKSNNLAGGVYEPVSGPDAVDGALRRLQATLSSAELLHRHARMMVQRWIPQEGATLWNFNALVMRGEIVSYCMGRRIRTDMRRDGAVGSMLLYGKTAPNTAVLEANQRLLRHVRYDGIMETEWSQSAARPDELYLYDFNPRPSGNFRWTLKSGVPMALQYYEASLGLPVSGARQMNAGVDYFKIFLRHNDFLWALRNPRFTAADKLRVLAQDAAALLRPGRHAIDIFDPRDPGPTWAASRQLASFCWNEAKRVAGKRFNGSTAEARRAAA